MQDIRFDDVAGFEATISEDFGPWGPEVEVSQQMINQFAELTGDRQWIHIDVERAVKESPFGGPIAHGFLTLSLVPNLNPRAAFRVVGHGNATNYGSDGFRFLTPVPASSKLHAHSRTIAVEGKPKGTVLTTETAIHVVGNDRPALIYKGLVMYNPPRT